MTDRLRPMAQAIGSAIKAGISPVRDQISDLDQRYIQADQEIRKAVEQIELLRNEIRQNQKDLETVVSAIAIETSAEKLRLIISEMIAAIPAPRDGKDADPEFILRTVEDAVTKAVKSIQIPIPRDGLDGRDAIELAVLPQIDESKSVPRGTYAMHRGGLWRSGERTKGMRGWDCVVNGIHSIEVNQADDGRTFQLDCELSNGDVNEHKFRLNHCIDRGVFADGKSYLTGDGVTHLGSYWIAKQDSPQRNPGQDQDEWRLAVRKGRDAKPTGPGNVVFHKR